MPADDNKRRLSFVTVSTDVTAGPEIRLNTLPTSKMIGFYYPEDVETTAALGKIAVYHGQLEYILRMTIKSILGLELLDALEMTRRKQSRELRERIQKEARQKLGDGDVFDRLNDARLHGFLRDALDQKAGVPPGGIGKGNLKCHLGPLSF